MRHAEPFLGASGTGRLAFNDSTAVGTKAPAAECARANGIAVFMHSAFYAGIFRHIFSAPILPFADSVGNSERY